jgi:hypothetical protein
VKNWYPLKTTTLRLGVLTVTVLKKHPFAHRLRDSSGNKDKPEAVAELQRIARTAVETGTAADSPQWLFQIPKKSAQKEVKKIVNS